MLSAETEPPIDTAPLIPQSPPSLSPSPSESELESESAPDTQVRNQTTRPATSARKKDMGKTQGRGEAEAHRAEATASARRATKPTTMTRTLRTGGSTTRIDQNQSSKLEDGGGGGGEVVGAEGGGPAGVTGSLVLTPQQISGVPVYYNLPEKVAGGRKTAAAGTYSGQFAYFYPHDGSAPSVLLLGKDSYLNVTEQQQEQHQLGQDHQKQQGQPKKKQLHQSRI